MQAASLSILCPVRDVENEVAGILQFAAEQVKGLEAEFIIVDMGSSDRTVLQAVWLMKELGLHGFVIQNGASLVPEALNTAIQKSSGTYLAFLFARRLYSGTVKPLLEAALRSGADAVFGCAGRDEVHAAERRSVSSAIRQPDGVWFARDMLRRGTVPDIGATLLRRSFLLDSGLLFSESCAYGYAEELLFRCFLTARTVLQVPVLLVRDGALELKRGRQGPVGWNIFQRTQAALRVMETARSKFPNDAELLRLLAKDKLPRTVMNCVDVALREGKSFPQVRRFLSENGYDRLLATDGKTEKTLKRRVFLWKTAPWLYRP